MQPQLKQPKKPSKRTRIILTTVLILATLAGGAVIYWNLNKNNIIRNKLEKAIHNRTDSLYDMSVDSIDVNETAGILELTNLHLSPDSLRARSHSTGTPGQLISLDISSLRFTGLKTTRALIHNQIVAGRLTITHPRLVLKRVTGEGSEDELTEAKLYRKILGDMEFIEVDTIDIVDADITSNSPTGAKRFEILGLDAQLADVKIDSASVSDASRILFAKRISVNADRIKWNSPKGYYQMMLDDVSMNTIRTEAHIAKFTIQPLLSETEFVAKMPYQVDRVDLLSNSIRLTGIDMKKLMKNQLFADQLIISSATCKMFRDLSMRRNTSGTDSKNIFKDNGKNDWAFHIGEIKLTNSYLEYREKTILTKEVAKFYFSGLKGSVSNVTNLKIYAAKPMHAEFSALLLGSNSITLNGNFYMKDPTGRFDLSGKAGKMNAKILNPLLEAESMAKIREGYINGLDFSLTGNRNTVKGTVNLLYNGFHLDVLEKDAGATKKDRKFITTVFANIKAKNENPRPGELPRVARVSINRMPGYSFVHASWRAVAAGISDITGINFN